MDSDELIPKMCEALFLLGSDGQKDVARQLVRALYAETHFDGLAKTIREEIGADGRVWEETTPGQCHPPDLAAENRETVGKIIAELELMREGLEFGELRSAYNGALDRLRVLESVLLRSR